MRVRRGSRGPCRAAAACPGGRARGSLAGARRAPRRGRSACACARAARRRSARSRASRGTGGAARRRPRRGRRARAGSARPGGGRRRPPRTGWRARCRRWRRSCRASRRPRRRARRRGGRRAATRPGAPARAVLSPRWGWLSVRPASRVASRALHRDGLLRTAATCSAEWTTRALHGRCRAGPAGAQAISRRSSPTRAAHRLRRGSWNSSSGSSRFQAPRSSRPAGVVDPRPQRLGVVGGHHRLAQPAVEAARARARRPAPPSRAAAARRRPRPPRAPRPRAGVPARAARPSRPRT